jgi:peptidoglycan/xylan/chitin deacetylase (PgdA/CDA1 family)
MWPETGFDAQPTYIPNDTVILTFDDVPDEMITTADLQWLDQNNVHVDWFTNTNNYCGDLAASGANQTCVGDIKDMLKNHNLGNHTMEHWHLGKSVTGGGEPTCPDATCVDTQIKGVETFINTLTSGATPHLTRFRAPFGEPYQDAFGAPATADLKEVAPVVAKYAVEVDWNLDSGDSDGQKWTGQSLYNNVVQQIKKPGASGASWGIILMHGVYQWTHDMLPLLIPYLQTNHFKLGSVEDVICWKYGKHSWEIVQQVTGQPRSPN